MKHILLLALLLAVSAMSLEARAQMACTDIFETRGVVGDVHSSAIPVLSIESLGPLEAVARGNFVSHLGTQTVFLKRLRASSQELTWLKRLNSLGLGVKLHGQTTIQDQTYAVIDFAEGINTQMPMLAPEGFVLTKASVQEIRRQAEILADNQIIPVDLQFQVAKDGSVVLMDPELFKTAPTIESARHQTTMILKGLFMPWLMEGKLEP